MSKLADTYVEISADATKYDRAMSQVRATTQTTWQRLQQQSTDASGRMMMIAGKIALAMKAAEFGVKGAGIAMAMWRGDVIATQKAIDDLYDSAAAVPVIGPAYQALEKFLVPLIFGGEKKNYAEFREREASRAAIVLESQNRIYEIRKESERKLAMVGKSPEERKALQIKFDLEDREEELKKLKAKMVAAGTFNPSDQLAITESLANLRRAYADQLAEINETVTGPQGLSSVWEKEYESANRAAPRLQAWEETMASAAASARAKAAAGRIAGRGGPQGQETLRDMLGTQIQREKDILKQLYESPEPTDFGLRQGRQAAINAHETKLSNLQRQFQAAKPEELSPNALDRMATDFGNALRESLGMSTDRGRPLKVQMQEGERLIEVIDKLSGVLPSLGALR